MYLKYLLAYFIIQHYIPTLANIFKFNPQLSLQPQHDVLYRALARQLALVDELLDHLVAHELV